MADPTTADVETFTQGRLAATDGLTGMLLEQALSAVRRYCGWHVVGVVTETLTVDGSGENILVVPSRYVTAVSAIAEDGVDVDLASVTWSPRGRVVKSDRFTYWTRAQRGVTVSLTHGYVDAPDFNAAVLLMVDRLAQQGSGGQLRAVGPFQYDTHSTWNPVDGSMFTDTETALLEQFSIVPTP